MLGKEIALGPGKADLLETIRETGSISSAARQLGLSYRRAWEMVDVMNRCFTGPLVGCAVGGRGGGGAALTARGTLVIAAYRAMEGKAMKASTAEWETIRKELKRG